MASGARKFRSSICITHVRAESANLDTVATPALFTMRPTPKLSAFVRCLMTSWGTTYVHVQA